jgi:hypothetical protein
MLAPFSEDAKGGVPVTPELQARKEPKSRIENVKHHSLKWLRLGWARLSRLTSFHGHKGKETRLYMQVFRRGFSPLPRLYVIFHNVLRFMYIEWHKQQVALYGTSRNPGLVGDTR